MNDAVVQSFTLTDTYTAYTANFTAPGTVAVEVAFRFIGYLYIDLATLTCQVRRGIE